jgi:hypothetical protein
MEAQKRAAGRFETVIVGGGYSGYFPPLQAIEGCSARGNKKTASLSGAGSAIEVFDASA